MYAMCRDSKSKEGKCRQGSKELRNEMHNQNWDFR